MVGRLEAYSGHRFDRCSLYDVSSPGGAAGAGAAGSASVSDSGFVFVLLSFISF